MYVRITGRLRPELIVYPNGNTLFVPQRVIPMPAEYKPLLKTKPEIGMLAIITMNDGWMYVGEVLDDGRASGEIQLNLACNLREWGTSNGYGELVSAPHRDTVLDAMPQLNGEPFCLTYSQSIARFVVSDAWRTRLEEEHGKVVRPDYSKQEDMPRGAAQEYQGTTDPLTGTRYDETTQLPGAWTTPDPSPPPRRRLPPPSFKPPKEVPGGLYSGADLKDLIDRNRKP